MSKGDSIILTNQETGKKREGKVIREDEYGVLVLLSGRPNGVYALIPLGCKLIKIEQKIY